MSDILCATYSIYFQDRRTRLPVEGCNLSLERASGSWRRLLNDFSTAEIEVQLDNCCACLPVPWVHEMVIERHGTESDGIVWLGPVTFSNPDQDLGTLSVEAADRSVWWSRRQVLLRALSLASVDAGVAWAAVRAEQERIDPTGLEIRPSHVGRLVNVDAALYSDVEAVLFDYQDVLWTVTAGQLKGPGPTTVGGVPLGTLDTAIDWDENGDGTAGPSVVLDGESTTTAVVVRGDGVTGVFPEPGGKVPPVGWHVAGLERPDLTTQAQVDYVAESTYQRNRENQLYVSSRSGSLRKGSAVAIADLDAGRRFTIDASTCGQQFTQVAELKQVVGRFAWTVEGGQGAIRETAVAVDVGPVGVVTATELLSG